MRIEIILMLMAIHVLWRALPQRRYWAPNGAGVAWLLAQHQGQLGHKTIKSVTIFWNRNGPDELSAFSSLVFHLEDVVPKGLSEAGMRGEM